MGEKQEIHNVTQSKGVRGSDPGNHRGPSSRSFEKHPTVPSITCKFLLFRRAVEQALHSDVGPGAGRKWVSLFSVLGD